MGITVRPLSPFGVEVIGLDLEDEKTLDADTQKLLRNIWVEHGIVLFRNALHSEAAHMRLSRVFGEPEPSAVKRINEESNPYLMALRQKPGDDSSSMFALFEVDGQERAGWLTWHWDQSFMPEIVRGALLRMLEPARIDGRTGYIDAIAAYDRLPEKTKQRIEGLEVVYQFTGAQERNPFGLPKSLRIVRQHPQRDETQEQFKRDFPPVVHPLVITQRETGRKVLKLSPMHCQYILGMDKSESDALLQELAEHLVDPRYAYFHTWQADDAIVWDNWRVIHCVTGVPFDVARYGQRTTIMGDYKLGRYLNADQYENRPTARFND